MKAYVPYEKLSKKKRRELDCARRGTWGDIMPVTRRPEKSTVYDRKAENRRWKSNANRHGHDCSGDSLFRSPGECRYRLAF